MWRKAKKAYKDMTTWQTVALFLVTAIAVPIVVAVIELLAMRIFDCNLDMSFGMVVASKIWLVGMMIFNYISYYGKET